MRSCGVFRGYRAASKHSTAVPQKTENVQVYVLDR
jgi:hypothetical protein